MALLRRPCLEVGAERGEQVARRLPMPTDLGRVRLRARRTEHSGDLAMQHRRFGCGQVAVDSLAHQRVSEPELSGSAIRNKNPSVHGFAGRRNQLAALQPNHGSEQIMLDRAPHNRARPHELERIGRKLFDR